MSNNLSLYKENLNNLTPLEITLRCHSRAIDFIQDSIDSLIKDKNKKDFIHNLNNALKILESFMYSLEIVSKDGSINEAAHQSFMLYEFTTRTLRNGMKNFEVNNFDKCCEFLQELYTAYSNMKF